MKKILFLGACLWALAGPARAQTALPAEAQAQTAPAADIVVVRLIDDKAIITRGVGRTKTIEFPSGISMRSLALTTEGYHLLFSQLYEEGYVLRDSFSPGTSGVVTLLFVKR